MFSKRAALSWVRFLSRQLSQENCFPLPSPMLLVPNQEPDSYTVSLASAQPNLLLMLGTDLKDQADLAAP